MGFTIFPTENDIATQRGGGIFGTEARLSASLGAAFRRGMIVSGLEASIENNTTLTMSIASGLAIISGYAYISDAAQTVTVNASETNAVWYLQLVRDSATNDVQGIEWTRVVNPSGSADDPVDSCRVFSTTTSAAQITNFKWERSVGRFYTYGEYLGDGNPNREIYLGYRPLFVVVFGWASIGEKAEIVGLSAAGQSGDDAIGMYIDSLGHGTATSRGKRPQMSQYGFRVGSLGDAWSEVSLWVDNLNEPTQKYRYLVIA